MPSPNFNFLKACGIPVLLFCSSSASSCALDTRVVIQQDAADGIVMHETGYSDQPYMAKMSDGTLIAPLTVSDGEEGNDDQHIIYLLSRDEGTTWSVGGRLEQPKGPEASWAMPYVDGDRVFVIYLFNDANVRSWPYSDVKGARPRVDTIGSLAIRYSDDFARTWSDRLLIKLPKTAIDTENSFNGAHSIFWLTGKPVRLGDAVYLGISKVGPTFRGDLFPKTEGFLVKITNLLDPKGWSLIPKGDRGFRAPDGSPIMEEPSITTFGEEGLYVTHRTATGKLARAVSLDAGETWDVDWARYETGEPVAHPRAKSLVHKLSSGAYFLWFHNNSGTDFKNRNPVWYACGRATEHDILWSKPNILIKDKDESVRMSYPSVLELDQRVLISYTNKHTARVHTFAAENICR